MEGELKQTCVHQYYVTLVAIKGLLSPCGKGGSPQSRVGSLVAGLRAVFWGDAGV